MNTQQIIKPIFIKAPVAAKLIGISAATFYRWKKEMKGFPVASPIGGATFYKRVDVEAFAEKLFEENKLK